MPSHPNPYLRQHETQQDFQDGIAFCLAWEAYCRKVGDDAFALRWQNNAKEMRTKALLKGITLEE